MQELGYNYRLTDMQAALGISQLAKLDWSVARRIEIAEKYDEAFKGTKVKIPKRASNIKHAFHLYVIQVDDRLGLYNHLKQHQIFAQVHYVPVHTMPYYKKIKTYSLPIAESYYSRCLSIPMFPTLTAEEQNFVIEKVLEFCK
jgi:dTDP-4-amino-4,6-dideoxygalactose transaminase